MYRRQNDRKSNSTRAAAARFSVVRREAAGRDFRASAQLRAKAGDTGAAVIQLRDHYYWYRTGRGSPWVYAGKFKNHATANAWLKANKAALGIWKFGEGNSAHSYR